MSAKPTELKKLIALLDSEAESVEELAATIWNLVEELVRKREQYVIIAAHPSLELVQAIGPYSTRNKAVNDMPKRISAYDTQSFARLAILRDPDSINL